MIDERETAATPLVQPHDGEDQESGPQPVPTDAPVSTDENGKAVDLPDRGGTID